MNRKMVFFLVLVLAILAFALFNPYSISAEVPKEYKIISAATVSGLEKNVTAALNDGWSLVGGPFVTAVYSQAVSK